jgi:outer membrane protein TolC
MPVESLHLKSSCVLAALLAAAPVLAAGAEALALREAQRAAVERSRSLDGQRQAVAAAREMAAAASRLPDPVLTFGLENVPLQGADRFSLSSDMMTMKRVGVMQELTGGDKLGLRAERFEAEARKGLAEQEALVASIQRDTALAWLDAYYTGAMVAAAADQRERAVQEAAASEAQYRAGRGSQADVLMAHANVAMLDDRVAELQRKARSARTLLGRWIGEGGDRTLGPRPDIGELSIAHHDQVIAAHPQIAAMARAEEAANVEAKLASASRNPDWSVQLAWQERSAKYGDMFSVMVSVPLPWDRANRQDREVAAKLAAVEQARAAREEAVRTHIAEFRTMEQEWEVNRSRIARFEREIVPLAAARVEATLAAYRAGKSSQSDVLAARRAELDARLQALALESETARLWAQLNYFIPESPR